MKSAELKLLICDHLRIKTMSIDDFPEIEAFQKLPRRIIVKGGVSRTSENGSIELAGIVINNLGQPVKDLRVNLVLFDEREIPLLNLAASPDPSSLDQGQIASFRFVVDNGDGKIASHYLYAGWKYDDSNWR